MKKRKFSGSAPMPVKTGKSKGKPAPSIAPSMSAVPGMGSVGVGSSGSAGGSAGGGVMKKGGSVKGKTPMTPSQKKFAALAPPKNKITFADRIAGSKKRK